MQKTELKTYIQIFTLFYWLRPYYMILILNKMYNIIDNISQNMSPAKQTERNQ